MNYDLGTVRGAEFISGEGNLLTNDLQLVGHDSTHAPVYCDLNSAYADQRKSEKGLGNAGPTLSDAGIVLVDQSFKPRKHTMSPLWTLLIAIISAFAAVALSACGAYRAMAGAWISEATIMVAALTIPLFWIFIIVASLRATENVPASLGPSGASAKCYGLTEDVCVLPVDVRRPEGGNVGYWFAPWLVFQPQDSGRRGGSPSRPATPACKIVGARRRTATMMTDDDMRVAWRAWIAAGGREASEQDAPEDRGAKMLAAMRAALVAWEALQWRATTNCFLPTASVS